MLAGVRVSLTSSQGVCVLGAREVIEARTAATRTEPLITTPREAHCGSHNSAALLVRASFRSSARALAVVDSTTRAQYALCESALEITNYHWKLAGMKFPHRHSDDVGGDTDAQMRRLFVAAREMAAALWHVNEPRVHSARSQGHKRARARQSKRRRSGALPARVGPIQPTARGALASHKTS